MTLFFYYAEAQIFVYREVAEGSETRPAMGGYDGSRGGWGVFLRASVAVFCRFKGGVYLEPMGLMILVNL
jgi:hypothetical protein